MKSQKPNLFHYATIVTHKRVQVFRRDKTCQFLIDAIAGAREKYPFKLIGYVIMPDHLHIIVNPLAHNIGTVMKQIKGVSAHDIIEWLRVEGHEKSLAKLKLENPQKRSHQYAMWLKEFFPVELWSLKFVQQKLQYIHNNPVRAGLCNHPAEWKWSSYRAYFPHEPGSVPIEIDWQAYWKECPEV
ncbi:MAG: transposase [Acidobacteria bacterium]|nr:transposase [Acidobacteriota bacterium]